MADFDKKASSIENELKARISMTKGFGEAGRSLNKWMKDHPGKGSKAKALSKKMK